MSKSGIIKLSVAGGLGVAAVFTVTTVKTFIRTAKQAGVLMKHIKN